MRSVMGMLGVAMLLALAAVQLSAAEPVTSSSDFVVEYPIPVPDSGPLNIVVESPGRVWFTMSEANMIGSLVVTSTTEYRFTTFAVPTANSVPYDLVFSDGLVWFTENAGNQIGRLDPASGTITEYSIPTANSGPAGIDVAPDGMMWFVERDGNRLGSLDPDTGIITDTYQYSRPDSRLEDVDVENNDSIYFTAPGVDRLVNFQLSRWPSDKAFFDIWAPGSELFSVAVANDGYPWVTTPGTNWIGRYTPTTLSDWRWYLVGAADGGLSGIAVGVMDGLNRTWFAETHSGKVGQLVTSSSGTHVRLWEHPLPSINSRPIGVAADSEGHVWIAESGTNKIAEWRPPYYHSIFAPLIAR